MKFAACTLLTLFVLNCRAQHTTRYDTATSTWYTYYEDQLMFTRTYLNCIGYEEHIVHYYANGQKREEYSLRKGMATDTLWRWGETGVLEHMEICSDTEVISLDFWDNGMLFERATFRYHTSIPRIEIYDSTSFTLCETQWWNTVLPARGPYGICTMFHENGMIDAEGNYLPYQFLCYEPIIDTARNREMGLRPDSIWSWVCTEGPMCDGKWTYYNEQGEKIREEYYEGGLLKNTILFGENADDR